MQMPAAVGQQLVNGVAAVPVGQPLDPPLLRQLGNKPVKGALAGRTARPGRQCAGQLLNGKRLFLVAFEEGKQRFFLFCLIAQYAISSNLRITLIL